MKTLRQIEAGAVLALLALALAAGTVASQNGHDLYQQALRKERAEGDLTGAIALYRQVVATGDRTLGAQALLRIGESYEKLGRAEAREAYQRVLRDFADQPEPARVARARLAVLQPPPAADGREVVRSEGIVARQLWTAPAHLGVQALSPDGRQVVFVDWGAVHDPALRGNADVAVYDTRSGRARLVTRRPPQSRVDTYVENPAWSADGTQIAYSLWDTAWTHKALRLVRADGTHDRVLVDNPQFADVVPMAWSRAGDFLVARVQGWDETQAIALVSVPSGAVRVLRTLGTRVVASLSLSPDGRFIVYSYPQAEGVAMHDLFMLASDGSSEVRLAAHAADDRWPFWTPDGKRIVFLSDRSGQPGLWAVAVEQGRAAGEPELVRPNVGPIALLGFTHAGGLAYRLVRSETDVHEARLDLTGTTGALHDSRRAIESFLGKNWRPTWSPDGHRMAYLSMRAAGNSDAPHLVVRTVETGEERAFRMPFALLRQESGPLWSADGQHLLMEGGELGATAGKPFRRISYRIDAENGAVERDPHLRHASGFAGGVFSFATDVQAARLAAAGLRIAGQRDIQQYREGDAALRPGEALLWVREGVKRIRDLAAGGEEILAPEGHLHSWELSPDGAILALALPSDPAVMMSNVLWTMPVGGGEMREIARFTPRQEILTVRWTPDGRSLLFVVGESEHEPGRVWLARLDGRAPQRLDLRLGWEQVAGLSFHPDGERVAFTTTSAINELWVMEGFPWQRDGGG